MKFEIFKFLPYLAVLLTFKTCVSSYESHQYCIIGAGPGGLQMAYFLDSTGRDYVVFERNSKAGEKNVEFNWRHDWNSLLSHDESLVMGRYSDEYFPHADDLVTYFNDYADKLKLRIKYNTEVSNISEIKEANSTQNVFEMNDSEGNLYRCNVTIVSTGISLANIPKGAIGIDNAVGYESMSMNLTTYEGKDVLILGQGNSALEIAKFISPVANKIHLVGRNGLRQSWSTHYVGDVRGINRDFLDGMQLRFMDSIAYIEAQNIVFKKTLKNKIGLKLRDPFSKRVIGKGQNNNILRNEYDHIIRCLGFQFDDSIFNGSTKPFRLKDDLSKYPFLRDSYESVNVPNMYFAGSLAHSRDYRKSSGGFIHGFRYSIRALHQMLEWKYHGNPWPSSRLSTDALLYKILKRINEASGIYQMFGAFADIIVIDENGSHYYLEDVPIHIIPKLEERTGVPIQKKMFVLTFEYGKKFTGERTDTLSPGRIHINWTEAHKCNFIHPKIYYYEEPVTALETSGALPPPTKLHHVVEDFLTHWDKIGSHIIPIKRFLANMLKEDFNNYYADSCFEMMMLHKSAPPGCYRGQFMSRHPVFYLGF
ncbi:uncharacterized protein TRIADDRAFT_64282 [Trichoplax adhaerens]|uniref:FAD/NAD(P)-binding domain-containing protein n=1 Tax=Trichoplax adhaerens TaxID=10228 RepID=B3S8E6_TRIAD|nr:hypothetical protein TRIADDRAFT_64282 [Trichoplax adhaerens]EDV20868.1 hypothetical protein TRIADDRAFT_64282 [Trichoplax adhaerens]|eukprot:XP_002116512.1 hypothetical protein TRIADDRAFT_64282 [Trichoplax adhaerens]